MGDYFNNQCNNRHHNRHSLSSNGKLNIPSFDNTKKIGHAIAIAILIVIILLNTPVNIVSPAAHAQAVSTWAETVGSALEDGTFRGLENACDGGYIIAGYTAGSGSGSKDLWLIKVDDNGQIAWQKAIGGSLSDQARSIRQTCSVDGGYIISGQSDSGSFGKTDILVLKIDIAGNVVWKKLIGGAYTEVAHAVEPTTDDGYIIGGYTVVAGQQDYFVAKLSSDGTVQWQKTYGGSSGNDVIRIVKQLADGDYLIAGWSKSVGPNGDIWVLKLNESNGNIIWQKRYGGGGFEEPSTILEVHDGIIIMEESNSFGGGTAGWIFKIDSIGNMVWQKKLNGPSFDEFSAAQLTSDGGFVIAGEHKPSGTLAEDFWIVKFDSNGNVQWQKRQGGAGRDEAEDIALASDGGYVLAGITFSFGAGGKDIWVIKVDANGDLHNCSTALVANQNLSSKAILGASTAVPLDTSLSPVNGALSQKDSNAGVVLTSSTAMVQCQI